MMTLMKYDSLFVFVNDVYHTSVGIAVGRGFDPPPPVHVYSLSVLSIRDFFMEMCYANLHFTYFKFQFLCKISNSLTPDLQFF